jgi:hypothetical protein
MKPLTALAVILAVAAGSALARPPSLIDDGPPPVRYMSDTVATVTFATDINARCGAAPKGYTKLACAGVSAGWMVLPNACAYPTESYAQTVCHEMGHVNGWPETHGE